MTPVDTGPWAHTIEGWHDFFLMSGTAAVTLAGLLFVAISIHIEALVHPRREALIAIARAMLMSFIMVMALSLIALMPVVTERLLGVQCIGIGLAGTVVTLLQLRNLGDHDHVHFTRRTARRRLLMPIVGYAWMIWGGVGLAKKDPAGFAQVMTAIVILLATAASASWDLLVRVARMKRADAAE